MHVMIRLLFFFLCISPLFDFASIKPKSHFSKVKAKGKKGKKLKKRYKKKAAKQGGVILSQAKVQIVNVLKSINSNNVSEVAEKIKAVIIKEINAFFDVLVSTYINKNDNESDTFYDDTFNRAIDRILTDKKISFEINNERKFIGDILSFNKNKKEIVLQYKNANQEEENIIIFNTDNIQNFIDEIKKKRNKEVLEIVLQKIQEQDREGSTEFKIKGSTIIDGNNKEIVNQQQLQQITNGGRLSIETSGGTKIEINGKEIKEENIHNKLKKLIKKENKIENHFLEYLTKSISYFSPYIQGELNMWTIMYFLNSSDFVTVGNIIKYKKTDQAVLQQFIVNDDKNMYNFKELCEVIKVFIDSIEASTTDTFINKMRNKILEIHNKQKLFQEAPLDYKILCMWYDIFIVEAILAQEKMESKRAYREKIYQLFSQIFIDEGSQLFKDLCAKILKASNVFSQYNSYIDILEKKYFYFQSDFKEDAKDLREDNILVLDTDFNLSFMALLYMEIKNATKKSNVSISTDDIYDQIKYVDYTNLIKKMEGKQTNIIREIQSELKKLLDNKKNNLEEAKDTTKKNNMIENYESVSKNVLKYGAKIPLRKKPINPEQEKEYAEIIDSFKFTRHVRNAYVLLLYKNNHDIYEDELAGLFKKNEFLDSILNPKDDKLSLLNDYKAYKSNQGDFNTLKKEYEECKKKNSEALELKDIETITEFEKRSEAYNYYNFLEGKNIAIDETYEIAEFLVNIIAGYNVNEFFDINRLYYLIVQATNSTFYIDVVEQQILNRTDLQMGYMKEYIKSIQKLNSLYIKFLFYKLNAQVIMRLNPAIINKNIIAKIWAWTVGSLKGVLGTIGAAWIIGNSPALTSLLSASYGRALGAAGVLGSGLASIALTPKGAVVGSSLLAGTLIYKNSASIKNAFMNRVDQIGAWWENWWNGQEELKLK